MSPPCETCNTYVNVERRRDPKSGDEWFECDGCWGLLHLASRGEG